MNVCVLELYEDPLPLIEDMRYGVPNLNLATPESVSQLDVQVLVNSLTQYLNNNGTFKHFWLDIYIYIYIYIYI